MWMEIVLTILTLAWGFFKTTEWYTANVSQPKRERALLSIQAAVREVYETYTRELKAANADGKLTDEERKEARSRARDAAIAYGKANGVDLIATLGDAFMDVYLERAHKELNKNVPIPADPAPPAPCAPSGV
jgi:hypothetical protein